MQSALSGVDIALWDLKAKNLNVPVYELLGGRVRHKVRVYSWIGGDNPGDVEAQAYAEDTYLCLPSLTCFIQESAQTTRFYCCQNERYWLNRHAGFSQSSW